MPFVAFDLSGSTNQHVTSILYCVLLIQPTTASCFYLVCIQSLFYYFVVIDVYMYVKLRHLDGRSTRLISYRSRIKENIHAMYYIHISFLTVSMTDR